MTTEQFVERANKMIVQLKDETDRGKACIGAGIIEEVFKELFLLRVVDDKNRADELLNGPLDAHAARVKLAYCIGWIGKATFEEANRIRKIRNQLAHDVDVASFDHQSVRDIVDNLCAPKIFAPEYTLAYRSDKFIAAVNYVLMQLQGVLAESKKPVSPAEYPITRN